MCYTCGCKMPYDRHGDEANIIEDDIAEAGLTETIKKAGTKTAKENMLELIELQRTAGELETPKEDYN